MAKRRRAATVVLVTLAGLTSLTVAGVLLREWVFVGKKDGAYLFEPKEGPEIRVENGKAAATGRVTMVVSEDTSFSIDTDQTAKDFAEMGRLRQEGKGDLFAVIENRVEDRVARSYVYRYTLSDGRIKEVGRNDPREGGFAEVMDVRQLREMYRLRDRGEGVAIEPVEEEFEGKIFLFERQEITLQDGTVVIHSTGRPKEK